MAPYNPPHKVRTIDRPYRVMVQQADPNFDASKTREPFYEFTGRRFDEDTRKQGPYSNVPNVRE